MLIAAGLLILVFSLYYFPLKEAGYQVSKQKVPVWFYFFLCIAILLITFFIPYLISSLIEILGLSSHNQKLNRIPLLIMSGIIYITLINYYSTRIKRIVKQNSNEIEI